LRVLDIAANKIERLPREVVSIPTIQTILCMDCPLIDPMLNLALRGVKSIKAHFNIESKVNQQ